MHRENAKNLVLLRKAIPRSTISHVYIQPDRKFVTNYFTKNSLITEIPLRLAEIFPRAENFPNLAFKLPHPTTTAMKNRSRSPESIPKPERILKFPIPILHAKEKNNNNNIVLNFSSTLFLFVTRQRSDLTQNKTSKKTPAVE